MHRFYAERMDEDHAALPPEEASHALRVLRMGPGDACQALLEEKLFSAHILETEPRVILALEQELPSPEPGVLVTLYQGIPKGDKMDYIVQKCTEAGVRRIVPVAFSRCVARWDARDAEKKRARLQRIAMEAAKQSGRAVTPEVLSPISPSQLETELALYDAALIPWEEERGHGLRANWQGQKNVAVVIGPEGGLDEKEIARMREAGGVSITLGPRIFRTETAGLAAILSLLTLSGDLE